MSTRRFALIIGVVFLLAGIAGFIPALVHPPHAGAPDVSVHSGHGYLLGLFPVNVLHNIVHLLIGVGGIATYGSFSAARMFSRILAIFYGLLAIMGLIPALNTTFGLIPIHGHDVWLHAVTAVLAAYFGWFAVERHSVEGSSHDVRGGMGHAH